MPDEESPRELAALYVEQLQRHRRGEPSADPETSALWRWEALIANDPERAWPVFGEIVAMQHDDETLQQVGYRIRLLLCRHYDAFHERARALVEATPRFARIVGDDFFDEQRYREQPLDVDELIAASVAEYRSHGAYHLNDLVKRDPETALPIAIEIIHRGPAQGIDGDSTYQPLHDLLIAHGDAIIERVEAVARESFLVRRALWRITPQQRGASEAYRISDALWPRVVAATAGTAEFTDDAAPEPEPRTLDATAEELLELWFIHEKTFWAWETMNQLTSEKPEEAWPILLRMLADADEGYAGYLSAGPLEDLLHAHGPLMIDRVAAEARVNQKLRKALTGVYLWDSEVFPRYLELMNELELPAHDAR